MRAGDGLGKNAGNVVHHLRRARLAAEGCLGVCRGFPVLAQHDAGQPASGVGVAVFGAQLERFGEIP